MKKFGGLVLGAIAILAIASLNFVNAQTERMLQTAERVVEKTANGNHHSIDAPQELVLCTGWHALCSASTDCKVNGDKADCDCFRVNEAHIVMTAEIQDVAIKRLTQAECTGEHPCSVDEAPVCNAIKYAKYKVDHANYDWVSTYSYRGWCGILSQFKACDQRAAGYTGDQDWAICDAAPCTINPTPSNPEKPLVCQCRVVKNTPFVGTNGSCNGDGGGIMSSFHLSLWDFEKKTYPVPVPGYEYVQGACAPLTSDR